MGKIELFIIAAALVSGAVSCSSDGFYGPGRRDGGSGRSRFPAQSDPYDEESDPEENYTFQMTGVRYRDGYDWRRDDEYGDVECVLFMLKDGEPVFEFPVGPETRVASDEDMHHMSGGHIFTDYSSTDSTFIMMDGNKHHSYKGREMVASLECAGGEVHTLCEPRSGKGFTYRKDGRAQIVSAGSLCSGLFLDGSDMCFYYEENGRYKMVVNGVASDIVQQGDGVKSHMICATRRDGTNYSVVMNENGMCSLFYGEKGFGGSVPVVYAGGHVETVREMFLSDRFFLYTVSVCYEKDGSVRTEIWNSSSSPCKTYSGLRPYKIMFDTRRGNFALIMERADGGGYTIVKEDSVYELPEGFKPHSRTSADYCNRHLKVALDSPEGPVLWTDGTMEKYFFNGYIDCLKTSLK